MAGPVHQAQLLWGAKAQLHSLQWACQLLQDKSLEIHTVVEIGAQAWLSCARNLQ